MLIPYDQEFRDRLLQIFHTVERAPTHPFGCQLGEPALDEIQPTEAGRHKVGDETQMPLEPIALRNGSVLRSHRMGTSS